MKETKFPDPPTVEEFEAMISWAWLPGIRDDCRRIEKWLDEDGAAGGEERIRGHIKHVRSLLDQGKDDAIIATAHMALWTAVRTVNREIDKPYVETGRKIRDRQNKGGRAAGETISRDLELAKEFQRRRWQTHLSETALKADIGKARGLGRTAAIDAINRGLKKLSG